MDGSVDEETQAFSPRPLFRNEDFLVIVGNAGGAKRGLQKALDLLGGRALEVSPGGAPANAGARRARGIIASTDALAAFTPAQIQALRRQSEKVPLLLFPARGETGISDDGVRVMRALGLPELAIVDPAPVRTYAFGDDELLWPFCGLRLAEDHNRVAAAVAPQKSDIDSLIWSERGCTFFRWQGGPQQVFVSTTSPLEALSAPRLKDEFRPARFAALLPLMLFARMALGDAGWHTPTVRATLMIDDPNLRSMRYGFLNYRSLVDAARERDLHFTIAMIPIDYKKTSRRVARWMRENRRYMSLVPHGVEHLKAEFDREVTIDRAVATLREGLRRMRIHQEATGVGFSRAMTFPHGGCNSTWLEAMRRTGFQATFATRTLAFKPEAEIHDPLYQMYPAEMTFRGFPIVNRFEAEKPKEGLLFQAWLGKPLVVYTHHGFFRDGMAPTLDIAEFLARQVNPTWASVESILNGNYQWRRPGQAREVRVFSNSVTVATDQSLPVSAVLKPEAGPPAQETARVDGAEVSVVEDKLGLVIREPTAFHDQMTLTFEPRLPAESVQPYRSPLKAGVRRLATEIRDHSAALTSRT